MGDEHEGVWNLPESEYILVDQWNDIVFEFKARGFKAAIQKRDEYENGFGDDPMTSNLTLYIKVASQ